MRLAPTAVDVAQLIKGNHWDCSRDGLCVRLDGYEVRLVGPAQWAAYGPEGDLIFQTTDGQPWKFQSCKAAMIEIDTKRRLRLS